MHEQRCCCFARDKQLRAGQLAGYPFLDSFSRLVTEALPGRVSLAGMKSLPRTPFASALAGGLVVGLLGWVAIAAGWVEAGDDGAGPAAVPTPLTEPAADESGGRGTTVNEIYDDAAPGVAFISADAGAEPTQPGPFGIPPQGGGTATGSGFVIDEQGRIITNAHVVAGADQIEVTLGEDGESYSAEVLGTDPSTDIAVIEVEAPGDVLEPLTFGDSSQVEVGDAAVAIGNPFGLDRTATAGIISAVQREINAPNGFVIQDAIQTDAPINPGNSGGPLLDAAGRVIGVNSQIESAGGQGNVGIGFAVPVNTAREVAQQLIDDGEVEHAFLGVSATDLTPEIVDALNLDADGGALVQSVVPDSPADEAGIEAGDAELTVDGQPLRAGGDLIIAAEGEAVTGMTDVIAAVDAKQPGDEIELTLLRGDEERTVSVELDERPASARQ
jgi:S1-C subfamily serine protease